MMWVKYGAPLGRADNLKMYYLRAIEDKQSLAYPPRLAVELGSYVDGEAHE